jgi:dTDP-4-amino-4,6-dideoxygalactose transaminase
MIPITKPCLSEEEVDSVREVIESGWVTQGPKVLEFEESFATSLGASYATAVSSCTTGLHLALKVVGVSKGDEVITVSHSYIATANAIRYCDAIPCFVDIEPSTYNIDPSEVEKAINKNTKAILCVHQMGMPCNLSRLLEISRKHDLPLIEDAACAIGSEYYFNNKWEKIGKPHGVIAIFSFHPRKIITTGDGGMITTNSQKYSKDFKLLRQHSMGTSDLTRHKKTNVVFETYDKLGYNYRLTDIQAAIGLVQLKKLDLIVKKRRELASLYYKFLENIPSIILPLENIDSKTNHQSFCIRFANSYCTKKIMQKLLDFGISSRRGILCAHLEEAYKYQPWTWCGKNKGEKVNLQHSQNARDQSIILPLFHSLEKENVEFICEKLTSIIKNY